MHLNGCYKIPYQVREIYKNARTISSKTTDTHVQAPQFTVYRITILSLHAFFGRKHAVKNAHYGGKTLLLLGTPWNMQRLFRFVIGCMAWNKMEYPLKNAYACVTYISCCKKYSSYRATILRSRHWQVSIKIFYYVHWCTNGATRCCPVHWILFQPQHEK